jgi:hypothetical protein
MPSVGKQIILDECRKLSERLIRLQYLAVAEIYIEVTFCRSTCIAFSYLFYFLPQMGDIRETRREKIYLFTRECKGGFHWASRSFWRLTRALITTLANRFIPRILYSYPRTDYSTEIHPEVKSRGKVSENKVKVQLFCAKCSGTCGGEGAQHFYPQHLTDASGQIYMLVAWI